MTFDINFKQDNRIMKRLLVLFCSHSVQFMANRLRNHSIGVWQIRIQASNLSLMKKSGENGYKFVERRKRT